MNGDATEFGSAPDVRRSARARIQLEKLYRNRRLADEQLRARQRYYASRDRHPGRSELPPA